MPSRIGRTVRRTALASAATLVAGTAAAQQPGEVTRSGALGSHTQTFSFEQGADVQRATLQLFPFAWQQRVTSRLAVDGYTAYAIGNVRAAGTDYRLSGPVDSWARVRWLATRSVVVAVGLNFPTGVERHTGEQAVVTSVLSNDLLGFREGSWGAGSSGTLGLSTARAIGRSNLSVGGSYRTASSFQPSVDTTIRFAPGSETRFRVGLDAPVAGGRLESGLTFQTFTVDRFDRRNLFQAGPRYRADLSYRRGAFTLFAADLLRKEGELTLPVVNVIDGAFLRDTTMTVGWQNLAIVGATTSMQLTSSMAFQPSVEVKMRNRADRHGRGWITGIGGVLPMVLGTTEVFPSVKATFGKMIPVADQSVARSMRGAEVSLILRRANRAAQR